MSDKEKFSYPSADGKHLIQALRWNPTGDCRGVVQIVHGLAEYTARYDAVATGLCKAGFAVCGADHLGHGETATADEYGFFAAEHGWKIAAQDVQTLCSIQKKELPRLPYFMLGHSLGSFLVRTCLIDAPTVVDGAILTGTGHPRPAALRFARSVIRREIRRTGARAHSPLVESAMGLYNQPFRPNRTKRDWTSRDAAAVDAALADPLCSFMPTVGLCGDLIDGLRYITKREHLVRMKSDLPMLILAGTHDPVGEMGIGVRRLERNLRSARCSDLTTHYYAQARHELFHESNRQAVYEDLLRWLMLKTTCGQ